MFKELTLRIHTDLNNTFDNPQKDYNHSEKFYTDAIETSTTADVYKHDQHENKRIEIKNTSVWNLIRDYIKDLKIFIFLNADQIQLTQNANLIFYANLNGITIRLIIDKDVFDQIKNELLSIPHQNYVYFNSEHRVNREYSIITYILGNNIKSYISSLDSDEVNIPLAFNDETFQRLWSEKHQTYFSENFVAYNLTHHQLGTVYYPDTSFENAISFDFAEFEKNLQDIIQYAWIDSRQQTVSVKHHIDQTTPTNKKSLKPINNSRLIKQLAYLGQYSSIIHD